MGSVLDSYSAPIIDVLFVELPKGVRRASKGYTERPCKFQHDTNLRIQPALQAFRGALMIRRGLGDIGVAIMRNGPSA